MTCPLPLHSVRRRYANGFKQLCPGGDTANCVKVASWYVGDRPCDAKCASCGAPERQEPIPTVPFINNYRCAGAG